MEAYYRKNAGAVIFDQNGKVLMCRRADKHDKTWQFPQGGIELGEDPIEAAARELQEETGIYSFEFVSNIDYPIRYRFTPEILENFKKINRKDIGQDQYWSLFFLTGSVDEIDFETHPEEIEFKDCQWTDIKNAPDLVVDFKREAYQRMVEIFAPKIESFIHKTK